MDSALFLDPPCPATRLRGAQHSSCQFFLEHPEDIMPCSTILCPHCLFIYIHIFHFKVTIRGRHTKDALCKGAQATLQIQRHLLLIGLNH